MKKKKIIISIFLVLVLLMSAFVAVYATSGDEDNIFEQLKALITGNTNRIEKLEKDVDDLENEIDKLKGEITELQKPEEEKEKEIENKDTNNSNSSTNTASKKTASNNTTKKASTTTTATSNNQNKIDTLNKEIDTVKKDIEELEKQDNKQTKDIENLKTELNNKSEELKELVNSNNSNNSNNNNVLTKKDLIGSWSYENSTITFNENNTATIISNTDFSDYDVKNLENKSITTEERGKAKQINNYTYTLEGNYIHLTLVSATNQKISGTRTIKTWEFATNKQTTETVEIKEEKPVDNYEKQTKKIVGNTTIINNSMYLNALTSHYVKNK